MKKECTHKFRLTEDLKNRIELAAKKKGISMTGLITESIESYLNLEPQIKPIEPAKKESKPEQPKQFNKPLNKPQKAKGIYSTVKRPNAKDSPNRTSLNF